MVKVDAQELLSRVSATIKPGDILVVVHDVVVAVMPAGEAATLPRATPEPVQQLAEPQPRSHRGTGKRKREHFSSDRAHALRIIKEKGPINGPGIFKLLGIPRSDRLWKGRVRNALYRLRTEEGLIAIYPPDDGREQAPRYVMADTLLTATPAPNKPANGALEL